MMLKYLGLPFEDVRIKFEDWPKEKTSGKFELQQVPVVECEPCGVRLSQTDAIMHRIGARFGMLPTNKPEKLYKVIWWCNTAKDIMEGCFKEFLPIPAEKKKEMRTALFEKSVPVFLHAMEERLKMNKSQCTLVGRKYTLQHLLIQLFQSSPQSLLLLLIPLVHLPPFPHSRSEERRVGKQCVITCRFL